VLPSEKADTGSKPATVVSFEAYARLLTLLLPRMRNFAVHDSFANLIWSTPDWSIEHADDFVREVIGAALQNAEAELPALGRAIDHDRGLYTFALRAEGQEILAAVSLEVTLQGKEKSIRPVDTLRPFVQPAIECLQRELKLRAAVGARSVARALGPLGGSLPLGPSNDLDALDEILRTAFEHTGCALASLWIPERGLSLSLTPSGNRMSPQLLRGPQQQLFESLLQHQRTIVVNHAAPARGSGTAANKIIACPIAFRDGRLAGLLSLFNPPSVADFQPLQARSAELLAKCLSVIVNRGRAAFTGVNPLVSVRHAG